MTSRSAVLELDDAAFEWQPRTVIGTAMDTVLAWLRAAKPDQVVLYNEWRGIAPMRAA